MVPELRLIRYFVAIAECGTLTQAGEVLHVSQPSLSQALKHLEAQLGVPLVHRDGRTLRLTAAGEILERRGRALLRDAEELAEDVRGRGLELEGRLRLGVSPTARYGPARSLIEASAAENPAVMLYTAEDTTGALLRKVASGQLDLAVTFCAGRPPEGVELLRLLDEPCVVHLPADHRLADRSSLSVCDLADEVILVAASDDSSGFTRTVLGAFEAMGIEPRTAVDPYPDLGLKAVRDGRGVVLYPRSAFSAQVAGSRFIPIVPELTMPFDLAWRPADADRAIRATVGAARTISRPDAPPIDRDGR